MKAAIFLSAIFAIVAVASAGYALPATTLYRTPHYDSAIIHSERLGGNFAYSTAEGHAYTAVSPVIQHVARPVALSYNYHYPYNYPYYNYNYLQGYPSIFQYPIAGYPAAGFPAAAAPIQPVAPLAPARPIISGDSSLSAVPGSGVDVA